MYVLAPHISLLRSFKSCFGILFYKYLVPPGPRTQTTEKTIRLSLQRHQTRRPNPACRITQIFSNKISRTESAPKTNNKPTAA